MSDERDGPLVLDESGLFTESEQQIIRTIARSKVWRLVRDFLGMERERLMRARVDPASPNVVYALGLKEGGLDQLNRLLREGPRLGVYYERYVRQHDTTSGGSEGTVPRRPGDPPDLE